MVLSDAHQKIADAVIEKAKRDYPDSVDLISVHGSVLTGDTHPWSDLDLNIVIRDPKAYGISECFILEDSGVGYDIYCTPWERLEAEAAGGTPYISRLMDGEILYAASDGARERYLSLREKTGRRLNAPFSRGDLDAAETCLAAMKDAYFGAMTAAKLSDTRFQAAFVIQAAVEAVMTVNKKYFKRGVKRTFEELSGLDCPDGFEASVLGIIREKELSALKEKLTAFAGNTDRFLERFRALFREDRALPSADNLTGTYEEMISNWHKKVREAAAHEDVYSAFMAVASMSFMRNGEIGAAVRIEPDDVMACFDPEDLPGTFDRFEEALERYKAEYEKAGITVRSYADADAFRAAYLGEK